MRNNREFVERAVAYLKERYGATQIEISEIYTYAKAGVVEISGSFKRETDSIKRRFTIKIRREDLEIVAFGLR